MGHVGGRRFSVGELHAASKTSSANVPHLIVWGFDISAAEFPQQKKRASFFCCGNSAAVISKSHTSKWDPLADEVLEAAWSSPTEKTSSANVPHLNVWGFDISAAEKKRASLVWIDPYSVFDSMYSSLIVKNIVIQCCPSAPSRHAELIIHWISFTCKIRHERTANRIPICQSVYYVSIFMKK